MIELELPFPPSVNHYYRHVGPETLISREGRTFRKRVCALLGGGGLPPYEGPLALCMDAFPPDRRRRDLDNIQKATLDAIEHAGIYHDDSQINLLVARRRQIVRNGRLVVCLDTLPLRKCPLCGGIWENNHG